MNLALAWMSKLWIPCGKLGLQRHVATSWLHVCLEARYKGLTLPGKTPGQRGNCCVHTPCLIQNLPAQLATCSFCFQNLSVQMGCGYDNRDQGKAEKKKHKSQVSSTCYYTHQTLLIRQQQNFINRTDIIEWACYKWALSGPYSATKWVFAVECAHLRHQASCWITNDCY